MKLFLVRHGQTVSNVEGVYAGQTDVMLTDDGRAQAMKIRPILEKFRFDKVYSSDLSRAIDTQELALPFENPVRTPLLREVDTGSVTGKTFADFSALAPENVRLERDYSYFGGESRPMVCDRVRQFLKELEQEPCENVAAFAHNGLILSAAQVVLGAKPAMGSLAGPNCGIHVFEFSKGKWKILAWNYMGDIT